MRPKRSMALLAASATLLGVAVGVVPAAAEPGFSGGLPLPPGPGGAWVGLPSGGNDLDCVSVSSCTSVLPAADAPTNPSSAPASEVGGAWSAPTALSVPAGAHLLLEGVSCPSTGNCVAVGWEYAPNAPGATPVIATESGGSWTAPVAVAPPSVPHPAQVATASLAAIHCTAVGTCVAIGEQAGVATTYAFAVASSGGTWSAATSLPPPANAGVAQGLPALSCASSTQCTAVVTYKSASTGAPLAVAWTDSAGVWGDATAIGTADFVAMGLACPSAARCFAVGSAGNQQPAVDEERGGTWLPTQELPLPRLAPPTTSADLTSISNGVLNAISCPSSSLCVAEGTLIAPWWNLGGAVTWSSGQWSSIDVLSLGSEQDEPGGTTVLGGIDCPSSSECVVDGAASHPLSEGSYWSDFSALVTPTRAVTTPGAPQGIAARAVGSSIVVKWAAPLDDGGSPVLAYQAIVDQTGATCRTTTERCVFGDLRAGRYRVRVLDRTSGGSSRPAYSGVVTITH